MTCSWEMSPVNVPGTTVVDVPRFDDIPPQLFLHNERDYLDLGTQVITSLGPNRTLQPHTQSVHSNRTLNHTLQPHTQPHTFKVSTTHLQSSNCTPSKSQPYTFKVPTAHLQSLNRTPSKLQPHTQKLQPHTLMILKNDTDLDLIPIVSPKL